MEMDLVETDLVETDLVELKMPVEQSGTQWQMPERNGPPRGACPSVQSP